MAGQKFEALDIEDVSALLGVSERMVRNYVKDKGLPFKGDGRGRFFVWVNVLEWYIAYRLELAGNGGNGKAKPEVDEEAETYEAANTRKTIAEADLKELELATKRAEVVAIADAERAIGTVSKNVQQKLLSVPAKLTARLVGVTDRNRINSILDGEMRALCAELVSVTIQQTKRRADLEDTE